MTSLRFKYLNEIVPKQELSDRLSAGTVGITVATKGGLQTRYPLYVFNYLPNGMVTLTYLIGVEENAWHNPCFTSVDTEKEWQLDWIRSLGNRINT